MSDDRVSIELVRSLDAAEIAALYLSSRADALAYLRRVHTDDEVRDWVVSVMLNRGETWVARLERRIVGFLTLVGADLDQLYVLPGYYRRGIGSRLVNKAKERNPEHLRVFTFQRNARARAFYERHGFRIVNITDGSQNEEREPDICYGWSPDAIP